jgi:predicted RNA binding protein YcfA (HicA-like mRNA interferase family)
MAKQLVTTRDMVRVLRELGFSESDRLGAPTLFHHRKKGASVTLPTSRSYVPTVHLRAIEQTMENYDIISRRDFEKKLDMPVARSGT